MSSGTACPGQADLTQVSCVAAGLHHAIAAFSWLFEAQLSRLGPEVVSELDLQATLTARIELLARRDQAQEERICALEVTVRQIADELWRLKTSSAPDAGGAAVLYEADGERLWRCLKICAAWIPTNQSYSADSGFQGLAPSKENKAPSRHITPSGKRAALGMSPLGRKSPYIPDVQPSPGGMRKPAQRCLAFAEVGASLLPQCVTPLGCKHSDQAWSCACRQQRTMHSQPQAYRPMTDKQTGQVQKRPDHRCHAYGPCSGLLCFNGQACLS